jgi:hypothetical protein
MLTHAHAAFGATARDAYLGLLLFVRHFEPLRCLGKGILTLTFIFGVRVGADKRLELLVHDFLPGVLKNCALRTKEPSDR